MRTRTITSLVFSCVVLVIATGCTSQPTAPSSSVLPRPAGAASTPAVAASPSTAASLARFGNRTPGVIYVTSQGLYYDTFVVTDPLPAEGPFQLLTNGQTEFGPGDAGYLGGRWWEDLNGNGTQDPEDHYFLCPLLPPGRPTP
jgi:hypothetical protein